MSLEDLRRQYTLGGLNREQLTNQPLDLFADWMNTALEQCPADWVEPYAMTLATANPASEVSARIVLLRGYDEQGFVFYTNYDSAKGLQMADNPQASLVFYWGYLERQVRVEGSVIRVNREQSDIYFHKRPRGSQISAAVSPQSRPVESRDWLEEQCKALERELGEEPVPLPDNWGGYILQPKKIEFWQGRQNRLHDRWQYEIDPSVDNGWRIDRLSP